MSSYLALKVGYIYKTHTHTHSSLFDYYKTVFSFQYLKETTNYWSLSVSHTLTQLIMRVNKLTFAYKIGSARQ